MEGLYMGFIMRCASSFILVFCLAACEPGYEDGGTTEGFGDESSESGRESIASERESVAGDDSTGGETPEGTPKETPTEASDAVTPEEDEKSSSEGSSSSEASGNTSTTGLVTITGIGGAGGGGDETEETSTDETGEVDPEVCVAQCIEGASEIFQANTERCYNYEKYTCLRERCISPELEARHRVISLCWENCGSDIDHVESGYFACMAKVEVAYTRCVNLLDRCPVQYPALKECMTLRQSQIMGCAEWKRELG